MKALGSRMKDLGEVLLFHLSETYWKEDKQKGRKKAWTCLIHFLDTLKPGGVEVKRKMEGKTHEAEVEDEMKGGREERIGIQEDGKYESETVSKWGEKYKRERIISERKQEAVRTTGRRREENDD